MKKDIQGRIEEAMQSLDGLQSADANLFLWSKIKSRLQEVEEVVPQSLVWRMVAVLTVLVIVNVFTIFNGGKASNKKESGSVMVANEYSITLPQSY